MQVEILKKAKEKTKDSNDIMVSDLQQQVVCLQGQFSAVMPARSAVS